MGVSSTLLRAWSSCSKVDLRFSDAADEAAYKASCEVQLVRTFMLSCLSVAVEGFLFGTTHLLPEVRREDDPFSLDLGDPRTFNFLVRAQLLAVALSFSVLTCLRLARGHLARWNWEMLYLVSSLYLVASMSLLTRWHAAVMFDADPEETWLHNVQGDEVMRVMSLLTVVPFVCVYGNIRAHFLWLVAVGPPFVYLLMGFTVGSPHPENIVRVTFLMCVISGSTYLGARQKEVLSRERWAALRKVEKQESDLKDSAGVERGFSAVAGNLCDVVVMLDPDLNVIRSDQSHDAYFGQQIAGKPFAQLIGMEDQSRFHDVLVDATETHGVKSMPATFILPHAMLKAQMLLANTGGSNPKYIVGLHSGEHSFAEAVDLVLDTSRSIDEGMDESAEELQDRRTSVSLPTTTNTGHVFEDLARITWGEHGAPPELRQGLEHIAEIGSREHWLLGTKEIKLLPNYVLGRGGFGVVILGTLRGSAVAVKCPRAEASYEQLKFLAASANELRLLRRVRHTNIVNFHGACIDPLRSRLVMIYELVRGKGLEAYVQGMLQKAPEEQALPRHKIIIDTASGLRYLHSLQPQMVHGDIKPPNILVEEFGMVPRAKLLDFGLAHVVTKAAKSLGGTRRWMAPEIFKTAVASARAAPSSDVFSYGLTTYFVVTGRFPPDHWHEGMDQAAASTAVGQTYAACLEWPADTPLIAPFRCLIGDCLMRYPDARPSMESIQDRALNLLDHEPQDLAKMGWEVIACCVPGMAWEEGFDALNKMSERRHSKSRQRRSGSRSPSPGRVQGTPTALALASAGRVEAL